MSSGQAVSYTVRDCLLKYVIEGNIEGNDVSDGKTRKKT
jgi:hypothetical protein